jgi:hypothetical protein
MSEPVLSRAATQVRAEVAALRSELDAEAYIPARPAGKAMIAEVDSDEEETVRTHRRVWGGGWIATKRGRWQHRVRSLNETLPRIKIR